MRLIMVIAVALLLAACNASQESQEQKSQIDALQAKVASDQQEISTLDSRVSELETKAVATATAATAGSWIVWERRTLLSHNGPSIVTGPAPARPADAFDSKEACEAGALTIAQGHGATGTVASWVDTSHDAFGTNVDRVYYTCLPKGVPLSF